VSRLVGSLKKSTLEKLLEMGGDRSQRRKFLLDASQGITVEAVIDLVKAASAAEGQTVSHSMLRMLTKLAHHPSSGGARAKTDPTVRDVMRRLIDDWSLDDPNPEGYRRVLETMSTSRSEGGPSEATPSECEPERMIQIAIEVGAMGPQVRSAMRALLDAGRIDSLMMLLERAPSEETALPVFDFLREEQAFEMLLAQERVDVPLVGRLARRLGKAAVHGLIDAAMVSDDAKLRSQYYDLIQSLGEFAGTAVAARIPGAPPAVQRELLAFLGRLNALPGNFSASDFLHNPEPLIRREAVKLLLRNPEARDGVVMTALSDEDDRVVFVGLTAAQEQCPDGAVELIRQRVDDGDLDSQLRTMCIRIVGQRQSPEILRWLLGFVITEAHWSRRPKLRHSTPEMLAALGMIASGWRDDPEAEQARRLAAQSKENEVRAKLSRSRAVETKPRSEL
jgi:hypothetical protein